MIELGLLSIKTDLDFLKTFAIGELNKCLVQILWSRPRNSKIVFGLVPLDTATKRMKEYKIGGLGVNGLYLNHGWPLK